MSSSQRTALDWGYWTKSGRQRRWLWRVREAAAAQTTEQFAAREQCQKDRLGRKKERKKECGRKWKNEKMRKQNMSKYWMRETLCMNQWDRWQLLDTWLKGRAMDAWFPREPKRPGTSKITGISTSVGHTQQNVRGIAIANDNKGRNNWCRVFLLNELSAGWMCLEDRALILTKSAFRSNGFQANLNAVSTKGLCRFRYFCLFYLLFLVQFLRQTSTFECSTAQNRHCFSFKPQVRADGVRVPHRKAYLPWALRLPHVASPDTLGAMWWCDTPREKAVGSGYGSRMKPVYGLVLL